MQQSAENVTGDVTQIQTGDNATILLGGSHYEPKEPPALAPKPPQKFFGREQEIREIIQRLHDKKQVAIIGPGGIGP